jgi:hypothetical protein
MYYATCVPTTRGNPRHSPKCATLIGQKEVGAKAFLCAREEEMLFPQFAIDAGFGRHRH